MGNITEIAGGKISERSSQDIENNAGSFISNLASNFVRQKEIKKELHIISLLRIKKN
jgi:hypothetical protein